MDLEQPVATGELRGGVGSRTPTRGGGGGQAFFRGQPEEQVGLHHREPVAGGLDKSDCPNFGFWGAGILLSNHLDQITFFGSFSSFQSC